MARRETRNAIVATAADRPQQSPQPAIITDNEIACRAYDLYLARGREDGHDLEDWLEAERELRARAGVVDHQGAGDAAHD